MKGVRKGQRRFTTGQACLAELSDGRARFAYENATQCRGQQESQVKPGTCSAYYILVVVMHLQRESKSIFASVFLCILSL